MMKCISCERRPAKYIWTYEGVCKICWKKLIPDHRQRYFHQLRRAWHRIQKDELQFGQITERYWHWDTELGRQVFGKWTWELLARSMAKMWANVRNDLQEPPFPAGLRGFMVEMGWEKGKNDERFAAFDERGREEDGEDNGGDGA
jgi:hypothetical protein